MEKFIVTTGKTIDLAVTAALQQLGMDRDSVSVEVLENAKSGFLGIGASPAKVKVTYEVPDEPKKPEAPMSVLRPPPARSRRSAPRSPRASSLPRQEDRAGGAACRRERRPRQERRKPQNAETPKQQEKPADPKPPPEAGASRRRSRKSRAPRPEKSKSAARPCRAEGICPPPEGSMEKKIEVPLAC